MYARVVTVTDVDPDHLAERVSDVEGSDGPLWTSSPKASRFSTTRSSARPRSTAARSRRSWVRAKARRSACDSVLRRSPLRLVADGSRRGVGEALDMSAIAHEQSRAAPERRRRPAQILVREMWASLAISVMWISVVFAAVFAPDIVSTSASGSATTIPSGVAVALFAVIGTRVVAKYGFGRHDDADAD